MTPTKLQDYIDLLDSGTPFAQANYCDGEWRCIMGDRKYAATCDGQSIDPVAQAALHQTLREPRPYWHGVIESDRTRPRGQAYCRAQGWPEPQWIDKNIVHGAFMRGDAGPFLRALRRKRLLLVGPPHFERLVAPEGLFPGAPRVVVPARDALNEVERLYGEVRAALWAGYADVVCFSASFAAKVLIWRVWPEFCRDVTLYDAGSIFDPYCGVHSRGHMRKASWLPKLERNLRGALSDEPRQEESQDPREG
jgi:hypothetical protein